MPVSKFHENDGLEWLENEVTRILELGKHLSGPD
jgi:hypothetical protein